MSIPKVKRYENGKEIVGQVDTPYEITWEAWQLLTDAEKEKRKWLITDVPSADGFITVENMKLLWSNPSPTASFASQNITLSSSDYDFLLINARFDTGTASLGNVIIPKGGAGNIYFISSNNIRLVRGFTSINATQVTVGSGTLGASVNDNDAIPTEIYGFKKQTEIRFNALAENVKATVDYSTDEHPIGTWIDGSTLYEKTIYHSAIPSNVAHNIDNLKECIDARGFVRNSAGTQFNPIPYSDPSAITNQITIIVTSTQSQIRTSGTWTGNTGYVTLRYTKTT